MENQQNEQETKKQELNSKVKEKVEEKINKLLEAGIQSGNVDYLYKLIDIHKDIENEDYWKVKKEGIKNMRYNDYGAYSDSSYGRRGVPGSGRGRYSDGSYGRRGVPGTGRGSYRGEEMLNNMHESFYDYSDGKEEYNMGNYGAKEDTMQSLDYMLKSVVQFFKMLQEDADTEEEMQLIKKYSRKISEM